MIVRIYNCQLVGSEQRIFNEKYEATVPRFTESMIVTENIIPIGATLFIDGGTITSNENETNSTGEQKRRIMLIKPTIAINAEEIVW